MGICIDFDRPVIPADQVPGSSGLALHYIKKSISLHHLAAYDEWLARMEKGN